MTASIKVFDCQRIAEDVIQTSILKDIGPVPVLIHQHMPFTPYQYPLDTEEVQAIETAYKDFIKNENNGTQEALV